MDFKTTLKNRGYWRVLGLTIIGALIGFLLGFEWDRLKANKSVSFAIIGGLIGLICWPVYRAAIDRRTQIELESVEIKVPFVGSTLKLKINDAQRMVAWKILVELTTRSATQSLEANNGSIREALTSVYKMFDIVRTELKTMRPHQNPSEADEYTVESYALLMLNNGLRPLLSRWHPLLSRWEGMMFSEVDWPLGEACRSDLEITRKKILGYTWGLRDALKVTSLDQFLPARPADENNSELKLDGDIETLVKKCESSLSVEKRAVASHIFVELNLNLFPESSQPNTDILRSRLNSLIALDALIRQEIRTLSLQPRALGNESESIETIVLTLLTGPWRDFLSEWVPRFQAFDQCREKDAVWEKAAECGEALATLRPHLADSSRRLGILLGLTEDSS